MEVKSEGWGLRSESKKDSAIWRVDALLRPNGSEAAVLQPDENPWLNELLGSRRAAAQRVRVGLITFDWFAAVSTGGRLSAQGREMALRWWSSAEERTGGP